MAETISRTLGFTRGHTGNLGQDSTGRCLWAARQHFHFRRGARVQAATEGGADIVSLSLGSDQPNSPQVCHAAGSKEGVLFGRRRQRTHGAAGLSRRPKEGIGVTALNRTGQRVASYANNGNFAEGAAPGVGVTARTTRRFTERGRPRPPTRPALRLGLVQPKASPHRRFGMPSRRTCARPNGAIRTPKRLAKRCHSSSRSASRSNCASISGSQSAPSILASDSG